MESEIKIELEYQQVGDVQLPMLKLPEQPNRNLTKYGLLRRRYLKENRPVLWGTMMMDGTLFSHLLEVEDQTNEMLDQMMPSLAKEAGATEQLKARDPMKWVGLMNSCKAQAEEIILAELIYS